MPRPGQVTKKATVVCPTCEVPRQVGYNFAAKVRRGERVATCRGCLIQASGKPLCKHCGIAPVQRRTPVCWGCAKNPDTRAKYARPQNGRRGVPEGNGRRPAQPTTAAPGTEAKILVMEERAARGEQLFHPLDCRTMDGVGAGELMGRMGHHAGPSNNNRRKQK